MILTQGEVVKSSIFLDNCLNARYKKKFYVSRLFMYTHDWFMSMYGKNHYNIVISLQLK